MRDTRGNPMRKCAPPALLTAAVLAGTSGLQGQVAGGGAYLAVGVGFAQGAATESTLGGTNSPTRCDRLLYPNPADAPTDAGCAEGTLDGLYLFDPERGLTGSFALGYSFGALSVEVEALQRHQIIHNTLFTLGDLAGERDHGEGYGVESGAASLGGHVRVSRATGLRQHLLFAAEPEPAHALRRRWGRTVSSRFSLLPGIQPKVDRRGLPRGVRGLPQRPRSLSGLAARGGGYGERADGGRVRARAGHAGAGRRGLRVLAADVARPEGSLGPGSGR